MHPCHIFSKAEDIVPSLSSTMTVGEAKLHNFDTPTAGGIWNNRKSAR